jgi:serine/threonine-protein kinase RsbW
MSTMLPDDPGAVNDRDRTAPGDGLTGERLRFCAPARLEYREAARGFLEVVCRELARRERLTTEDGHRIVSAFLEAFSNACIHAYRNMPTGAVEVSLDVGAERLALVVADQGRPFVPDRVPEPDLEALPEGGMGLFIIRSFMDDVRYERADGWNRMVMEKVLGSGGANAISTGPRGPAE